MPVPMSLDDWPYNVCINCKEKEEMREAEKKRLYEDAINAEVNRRLSGVPAAPSPNPSSPLTPAAVEEPVEPEKKSSTQRSKILRERSKASSRPSSEKT